MPRQLAYDEDDLPIEPPSPADLAVHALELENAELRDRVKAVEAALKVAGRVLVPYLKDHGR